MVLNKKCKDDDVFVIPIERSERGWWCDGACGGDRPNTRKINPKQTFPSRLTISWWWQHVGGVKHEKKSKVGGDSRIKLQMKKVLGYVWWRV